MDEGKQVSVSNAPELAVVVSVIIRDFIRLTERLPAERLARLMANYYEKVTALVAQQQGMLSSASNHDMLVVFPVVSGGDHPARRALRFSLSIALIAYQMRFLIRQTCPGADLDHFGIGVGIHSGEVVVTELGSPPFLQRAVSGHAVAVASLLAGKSKELDWSVVCSEQTCEAIGLGVRIRRRAEIGVDWLQQPVRVVEVMVVRDLVSEDVDSTMRLARGSRSGRYKAFEPSLFTLGAEAAQMDLPQVPGYRCLKPVGRGGMSCVFLAERLSDKAQIALKFADSSVSEDSDVLFRFVEEYGLLEQVRHPHVLQIYDQGVTDDALFIAMEYLPGGTLKQRIGTQGLASGEAWRVLYDIVNALVEIHGRGIIHRDIKPANIMLREDGSAVLGDFGVAKRLHEVRKEGRPDAVVATPYFMSPEQALGQPEDDRTDIYSMGAVFYNMLTGQKPYTGDTLESIVVQHLQAGVPQLQPEHAHWQPLLDGMMAKDKAKRLSARELVVKMDSYI